MYEIIAKKLSRPIEEDWKPLDHSEVPETTREDLEGRISRLWAMEQAKQYSCIIIYADREHFSNLNYFTSFDMRFEEALLVLYRDGRKPVIVLGNESMAYSRMIPIDVDRRLYQSFSLMGQPNDSRSLILGDLLASLEIPTLGKVGLIGWKHYDPKLHPGCGLVTDVPHYIAQALISALGEDRLENATDLLSDCVYGLKHHLSAREIVQFEYLGAKVSRSVYRCIRDLEPGMSEMEASALLKLDGEPLATFPNVNFGDAHTAYGLASPAYGKRLALGDFIGVGYGKRGANIHKSGIYARSAADIPADREGYIEKMAKPYFASVVRWYEMMRIGMRGGDVWQMIEDCIGFEKSGPGLNPGHLIHTDEWTHSPFCSGSEIELASGMAIQCDFTVTFSNPHMTCHVEDGLVLADESLRAEIKALSPACWARIEWRRRFMIDTLNIDLPDEVLPMSDFPAVFFPFMADTMTVLAKAQRGI